MNINQFSLPTKVISGSGAVCKVGEEAKKLSLSNVLIVTDTYIANSLMIDEVICSLTEVDITYSIFDDVKPNPRDEECLLGVEIAQGESVDGVIAIGGGSVIDQAKAIAALVTNGGTCQDWHNVSLKMPMLPLVAIPTTAGTGSEVTFVSVITDTKAHVKMSLIDSVHLVPSVAILDPDLTVSMPPHLTAYTGMDVLTHAIEAYVAKSSQPITDAIALSVIETVAQHLVPAFKDGHNIVERAKMLYASSLAGMAFIHANVGAVHAISETCGALYDLPHGMTNAVFLPYIMEFNIIGNEKKYAEIARRLGVRSSTMDDQELAQLSVVKIRKLLDILNIPKFNELTELKEEDFPLIAELSAKNELSLDNPREIIATDYLQILDKASQTR